ncbi:MAG: RNA-directed DNA polymerase, partial [Patescibacteria group bacterium]
AIKLDIRKFFANISKQKLLGIISRKAGDQQMLGLIEEIIFSFSPASEAGIPLGNLTSQIFANIYLNELDRFVKHELNVKYYLRYGDDFILVHQNLEKLKGLRLSIMRFLKDELRRKLHPKNDKILKAQHGLKFLGVVIWPSSRKLNRRMEDRKNKPAVCVVDSRLNHLTCYLKKFLYINRTI